MKKLPPQTVRKQHRTPVKEFGDWRVPLEKPHEAEHLQPLPLGIMHRVRVQVAYWQDTTPSYTPGNLADWQPVRGIKRCVRLFIAWGLLMPLSVIMVFALMLQLYHAAPIVGNIDFWQSIPVWYSVLGSLVFAALKYFRLIDPILMVCYVLGHELTHALAAILCFGKVQAVSVDLDGGYVDTDTDNLFVSLAPYFVPLWMLLWMACFFVANWIHPFETYHHWFYAGFGFWWSFHVYWTMWVIPREQPDLLENGVVFSFLIIMLTNIAALILMLRCFGIISFHGYWVDFKNCAMDIYATYSELAAFLWQLI